MPGHRVRIHGNADQTTLSYPSGAPPRAPKQIGAGEVVDLEHVKGDFEVVGSAPFGVGSFMLGGAIQDPPTEVSAPRRTATKSARLRFRFQHPP